MSYLTMSFFKRAAVGVLLAAPLSLAMSSPSFAKHKKHHSAMKKPPANMMKSTPDSKQTPSGGQPGGPAGKN